MNIGMDRFPPMPPQSVAGFGAGSCFGTGRLAVFALLLWSVFLLTPAAAVAQTLDAYRLGPGDKLKVTVFDHPRSSGDFELDSLGTISYPLLGRVEARGKTIVELQEFLRSELDKKYIVNPGVSVEVLNYRPFYIYGEVNRAGSYPYVIGLTVRRAVAIAGGFTRRAKEGSAELVREGTEGTTKLTKEIDDNVLPGDIVRVQRRLF